MKRKSVILISLLVLLLFAVTVVSARQINLFVNGDPNYPLVGAKGKPVNFIEENNCLKISEMDKLTGNVPSYGDMAQLERQGLLDC